MKQAGILLFGLLITVLAKAQPLTPLKTSNYAGTQGIYLNPSSMADSRLRLQISFGLGAFGFTRQPVPFPLVPFGASLFSAGDPRGVSQAEVMGPGVMARLGQKHALGFTTRYRAGYGLSGSYDLVRWINGTGKTPPTGQQALNFAAEGFFEYAVSYAISLLDMGTHHLKIGGTAKLLRGYQRANLNTQATFSGGTATTLPFTGAVVNGTASDMASFQNGSFGKSITGKPAGRGAGFDVGAAYEFRPKQRFYRYHMDGKRRVAEELNKYLFRIGVSLLDIGQINFNQLTHYSASGRSGTLRQADYMDKNANDIRAQLINQFGLATGADVRPVSVLLPRSTSVQLDIYLTRSWFGNVVYQSDVPLPTTNGLNRGSVLAFGPRSEGPGGELAGTVYYYPTLQKVAIGFHAKAGIFIGGTDNLLGLFSDNGLAPHVYAGLALPFNARRPKDRDRDEVSDKLDRCPDVAGKWAYEGCLDTDNDNIQDKDDACPDVAGPVATNGCPDSDKDGVLDKDDACPDKIGPAKFRGCPDTDNDGVADNLDECPTIIGPIDMGGCSDTDKDGVRDSRDKCQREVGLPELDGCLLRNRTPISKGTDSLLVSQLTRSFVQGPRLDGASLSGLKFRLRDQPAQKLLIEFLGGNETQLKKMETLFRDELTRVGFMPAQFSLSIRLRIGEESGFAVKIE
jgi:hypothetical protein